MTQTYRCVETHDEAHPHYYAVFEAGGDTVRLACPPHEFGRFVLGAYYELTIVRVEKPDCKR